MGRPLRFLPGRSTVEVTTRTIQGRLLLRPSHEVNKLILGVVGRALALYPVLLHAIVVLSNHATLLVTTPDATTLARFMNFVNSNIARQVGRLHNWREKFWGRRYQNIPILDEESMVNRLRYLLAHGAKEGLVSRPRDWPGVNCIRNLMRGTRLWGTWVDRTAAARLRRQGGHGQPAEAQTRYEVPLAPLPCWASMPSVELRRRYRQLIRSIDEQFAAAKPIGRAAVCTRHPHSRPVASKRSPAPLCHASGKATREQFRAAYRDFVASYRRASARARAALEATFPERCLLPPFIGWRFGSPVPSQVDVT